MRLWLRIYIFTPRRNAGVNYTLHEDWKAIIYKYITHILYLYTHKSRYEKNFPSQRRKLNKK